MYAFGSTIDSRMNVLERLVRPAARPAGSLSRSGPTFPVAPAAVSVWHAPHALFLKTAAPATPASGDARACDWPVQPLVERRRRHHDRRRAHHGVAEAAELGADHRERPEPVRRDVQRRHRSRARCPASARTPAPRTNGSRPSTCRSAAIERSIGSRSVPLVRSFASGIAEAPGELLRGHVHAHRVGAEGVVPAEHDGAEDRRSRSRAASGSTVQTISRPVCPWTAARPSRRRARPGSG